MDIKNRKIISYRTVLNDAVACPWEPMPEVQPPTLRGLVEYLKKCPGWDYKILSREHRGWDEHQISHGARKSFWLPEVPNEEDAEWLDASNKDELDAKRELEKEQEKWI